MSSQQNIATSNEFLIRSVRNFEILIIISITTNSLVKLHKTLTGMVSF